ncbi:MAG: glycosyltransferase family 2 protein [Planctomycetes bacterium]|nr:glycosyltransferase family 2 protein [Planctomycetota bacterium]
MPTFEEGAALGQLLGELRDTASALGGVVVYLIDDGGPAQVELSALPASSADFDIVLARHPLNLGQGAALETARQLALADPRHDAFVMMDSDLQHRSQDLPHMVQAIRDGADVAFGNRFGAASNVPFGRRLLLWGARIFELAITRLWLSDAHNGYRAFSARALRGIPITQDRMAHATEIRQRVARQRRSLKIVEVPVTVRYSREALDKGQSSLGAISILRDLLFRFLFGQR